MIEVATPVAAKGRAVGAPLARHARPPSGADMIATSADVG